MLIVVSVGKRREMARSPSSARKSLFMARSPPVIARKLGITARSYAMTARKRPITARSRLKSEAKCIEIAGSSFKLDQNKWLCQVFGLNEDTYGDFQVNRMIFDYRVKASKC